MNFVNLAGSATPTLSGGDNTYRYVWESSANGITWVNCNRDKQ